MQIITTSQIQNFQKVLTKKLVRFKVEDGVSLKPLWSQVLRFKGIQVSILKMNLEEEEVQYDLTSELRWIQVNTLEILPTLQNLTGLWIVDTRNIHVEDWVSLTIFMEHLSERNPEITLWIISDDVITYGAQKRVELECRIDTQGICYEI